jgi:tetratricopeptide (TPR) repeat protein/CheY-like chemotaxis protein
LILAFIQQLERTGLDVTAEGILDALWLASGSWRLTVGTSGAALEGAEEASGVSESVRGQEAETAVEGQQPNPDDQTDDGGADSEWTDGVRRRIYARTNVPGAGDRTIPATPLRLSAARTLPDRLGLARALRPLRKRFRSRTVFEVDEEATAALTAEIRGVAPGITLPVLRPATERWYEADIVIEDDPAIEIWGAPLREFARVLGESGTFRHVHTWRLRLDATEPDDLKQARLETPVHGSIRLGQLGADPRRLVLFASHGASVHWRDGIYARLLSMWSAGTVVLLHLLPAERWARTLLGEPQGVCRAEQPGAPTAALRVEPHWWRITPDPAAPTTLRLPVTRLDADSLNEWALMQMSRGRECELYLLDTRSAGVVAQVRAWEIDETDVEWRLANLQEASPDATQLALALAPAPFTLPVARIVQEAILGRATDYTLLADLLLSGLVSVRSKGDRATDETTAFEIVFAARAKLVGALRPRDALKLAQELEARVSQHLADVAGRFVSFEALRADPRGEESLLPWMRPFASLGVALLDAAHPPGAEPFDAERFWRPLDNRKRGQLARVAARGLQGSQMRREIWDWLMENNLIVFEPDGERVLQPGLMKLLETAAAPLFGIHILWVDEAHNNNEKLVDQLKQLGVEEMAFVWSTEQALVDPALVLFDVIILDTRRIRQDPFGLRFIEGILARGLEIPVIVYASSAARDSERQSLWERGIYACVGDARELEFSLRADVGALLLLDSLPPRQESQVAAMRSAHARIIRALRVKSGVAAKRRPSRPVSQPDILRPEQAGPVSDPQPAPITAGRALTPRRRAAVVIGVDKIGSLARLESAAAAAHMFSDWLRSEGFEVTTITDFRGRIELSQISNAIKDFVDSGNCGQLVVYFAGHAFLKNDDELWLLSDAPADANAAVSLHATITLAQYSGVPNVVVITDACRSIPTTPAQMRVRGGVIFPNLDSNYRSRSQVDKFIWVARGRPSYEIPLSVDGRKMSVFTYCWLRAFQSPDRDMIKEVMVDGQAIQVIPNRRLGRYLQREVSALLASVNLDLDQTVDTEVLSDDDTYIGRVRAIEGPRAEAFRSDSRKRFVLWCPIEQRQVSDTTEATFTETIEYHERRVQTARETGDRRRESAALGDLGLAFAHLGDTRRAIEYQERSLSIEREIGDRRGECTALGNLGNAYADLGDSRRAVQCQEFSLSIAREIGDRRGEGAALGNLGNAWLELGEIQRAIECQEQSLSIAQETGDRHLEGAALCNLGIAWSDLGEARRAIEYQERSLAIAQATGGRHLEGAALCNLGIAWSDLGETRRAIEYQERSLSIAREIRDRRSEGAALGNLGIAYAKLGEVSRATSLLHSALSIFEAMGSPRAAQVHAAIAESQGNFLA